MANFDAIHRLCEEYAADQIALTLTADNVFRIDGEGKKVALVGIENTYSMEKYREMGAHYTTLVYNKHGQFSDFNTREADKFWL